MVLASRPVLRCSRTRALPVGARNRTPSLAIASQRTSAPRTDVFAGAGTTDENAKSASRDPLERALLFNECVGVPRVVWIDDRSTGCDGLDQELTPLCTRRRDRLRSSLQETARKPSLCLRVGSELQRRNHGRVRIRVLWELDFDQLDNACEEFVVSGEPVERHNARARQVEPFDSREHLDRAEETVAFLPRGEDHGGCGRDAGLVGLSRYAGYRSTATVGSGYLGSTMPTAMAADPQVALGDAIGIVEDLAVRQRLRRGGVAPCHLEPAAGQRA